MSPKSSLYAIHAYELRRMEPARTLEVFSTLSAPEFSEMDGEYDATFLDQGGPFLNTFNIAVLNSPLNGMWLGKAFTPSDKDTGHGYNMFWRLGRMERKYRMRTRITASRFDSKPVFQVEYAGFNTLWGWIRMHDEIRKMQKGLYLGIGSWGPAGKILNPFMIQGPIGPFMNADKTELWPFSKM